MSDLGALADARILDLDKVTDATAVRDVRALAQIGERTDRAIFAHLRARQYGRGHLGARADDAVLDDTPGAYHRPLSDHALPLDGHPRRDLCALRDLRERRDADVFPLSLHIALNVCSICAALDFCAKVRYNIREVKYERDQTATNEPQRL